MKDRTLAANLLSFNLEPLSSMVRHFSQKPLRSVGIVKEIGVKVKLQVFVRREDNTEGPP